MFACVLYHCGDFIIIIIIIFGVCVFIGSTTTHSVHQMCVRGFCSTRHHLIFSASFPLHNLSELDNKKQKTQPNQNQKQKNLIGLINCYLPQEISVIFMYS